MAERWCWCERGHDPGPAAVPTVRGTQDPTARFFRSVSLFAYLPRGSP